MKYDYETLIIEVHAAMRQSQPQTSANLAKKHNVSTRVMRTCVDIMLSRQILAASKNGYSNVYGLPTETLEAREERVRFFKPGEYKHSTAMIATIARIAELRQLESRY